MLSVLLTIVKTIGIVLLLVVLLFLLIVMLVLFVPFRYRITGYRREPADVPIRVRVRFSWLCHLVRVLFRYPEAAYIRVKVLCFTIIDSRKLLAKSKAAKPDGADGEQSPKADTYEASSNMAEQKTEEAENRTENRTENSEEQNAAESSQPGFWGKIKNLPKQLIHKIENIRHKIKNMRYTFRKICDKIKDVISHLRYYTDVIQSEVFQKAFAVCAGQLKKIIRHVKPVKMKAVLTLGLKDPGTTGQILEIYSMLYPIIGNNILIRPDFEHEVLEGDFEIKGRVSVYVLLWAAWKIYRSRDIRKVIRLIRDAEQNIN